MNTLKPVKLPLEAFENAAPESSATEDLSVSVPAHQKRFLTEHSTCAMCDTELEIRHEINLRELKVKEEAHCPSCTLRVRISHHFMH